MVQRPCLNKEAGVIGQQKIRARRFGMVEDMVNHHHEVLARQLVVVAKVVDPLVRIQLQAVKVLSHPLHRKGLAIRDSQHSATLGKI